MNRAEVPDRWWFRVVRVPKEALWQSGVIFTAASFVAGVGNLVFATVTKQMLAGSPGEFGAAVSAMTLGFFLSVPLNAAPRAVSHFLAQFRSGNDPERLQGLIAGCERLLVWLTLGGLAIAALVVVPLADFFAFSRRSLALAAFVFLALGALSSFLSAFAVGMTWFKRVSVLSILSVGAKLALGVALVSVWPVAEAAVYAAALSTLVMASLMFWRTQLPPAVKIISPWSPALAWFFLGSLASGIGSYAFFQSDQLVAERHFELAEKDAYSYAGQLARALVYFSGPLLTVLFVSRSEANRGDQRSQAILIALYVGALACGAFALSVGGDWLIQILGFSSRASEMLRGLSMAMVMIGLINGIGMWALANRHYGVVFLQAALGIGYWAALIALGQQPDGHIRWMFYLTTGSVLILAAATWWSTDRERRRIAAAGSG